MSLASQTKGERVCWGERGESEKAVSPKFGVMDWRLRCPCKFEILLWVGHWSQTVKTYLQNIQGKGGKGVC